MAEAGRSMARLSAMSDQVELEIKVPEEPPHAAASPPPVEPEGGADVQAVPGARERPDPEFVKAVTNVADVGTESNTPDTSPDVPSVAAEEPASEAPDRRLGAELHRIDRQIAALVEGEQAKALTAEDVERRRNAMSQLESLVESALASGIPESDIASVFAGHRAAGANLWAMIRRRREDQAKERSLQPVAGPLGMFVTDMANLVRGVGSWVWSALARRKVPVPTPITDPLTVHEAELRRARERVESAASEVRALRTEPSALTPDQRDVLFSPSNEQMLSQLNADPASLPPHVRARADMLRRVSDIPDVKTRMERLDAALAEFRARAAGLAVAAAQRGVDVSESLAGAMKAVERAVEGLPLKVASASGPSATFQSLKKHISEIAESITRMMESLFKRQVAPS